LVNLGQGGITFLEQCANHAGVLTEAGDARTWF